MFKRTLCVFLLIFCVIFGVSAHHNINNILDNNVYKELAEREVMSWVLSNYGEYYNFNNLNIYVNNVTIKDNLLEIDTSVIGTTILKAETVNDLPYIQGFKDELKKKKASITRIEQNSIDEFLSEIESCIGAESDFRVDIVVKISIGENAKKVILCYKDMGTAMHYPISKLVLPSVDEMKINGAIKAQGLLSEVKNRNKNELYVKAQGFTYDRIAARDYALQWSSNPTDCYDCGTTCGIKQDRTKWNNAEYSYITNLKHNDCCDFVSQALHAGGMPIDAGEWDRFNDSPGWAWTSVSGLKSYMNNKGYWESSTFANSAAGALMTWNSYGHIAMITLNDTVTHRYTAHTNDVKGYVFNSSLNVDYYKIKTN